MVNNREIILEGDMYDMRYTICIIMVLQTKGMSLKQTLQENGFSSVCTCIWVCCVGSFVNLKSHSGGTERFITKKKVNNEEILLSDDMHEVIRTICIILILQTRRVRLKHWS